MFSYKVLSQGLTALMIVPAVIYVTRNYTQHQEQIECLAKNVYWESRGEPADSQMVVAYVTVARAADRTEWGKTPCESVYQKVKGVPQFSWTPLHEEPKGPEWTRAREVALAVYQEPLKAAPAKLRCARYYKRTDDRGVSEKSKKYFASLHPVGQFGHHTAYCDGKGGRI
jgi:spore germination cell wall hydrolase CwlJ-like protein